MSFDGGDVQIAAEPITEPEEDEGLSPLSDRLMAELTAHRTLGLRQALGERPDVAFLAALHALTLKTFYHYGSDSCLELDLKSVSFTAQSPGLNDSASVQAIRLRHESWAKGLPKESADLWAALQDWDGDSRAGLLAHVVSLSVNAVHESWNRRPRALAHADHLAQAVDLDMAAAGCRSGRSPGSTSGSNATLFAAAQTRWQNSVGAFEDSLKVQAGVVGNITTHSTAMTSLVTASQSASGALQAAQAGNQLLALQSQQLSDLVAVLAAKGRADALEQARVTAAEAQGQQQYQIFSTQTGYQPGTVTMFSGN